MPRKGTPLTSAVEYEAKVLDIDVDQMLHRRYVYDVEPGDASRRVRLRDTGDQITLTVKEIDSWSRIPACLKIEADSRAEVVRVAALPGYAETDLTGENTTKVYARHGIDLSIITGLRFEES